MRTIARRTVIQAMSGLAVGSLLGGCGGSTRSSAVPAISNPNPQPVPGGTLTLIPITVTGSEVGRIGPCFAGLSYEKSSLALPRFSADNTDLIGMFTGLGSSLLRIGGNSVDQTRWAVRARCSAQPWRRPVSTSAHIP